MNYTATDVSLLADEYRTLIKGSCQVADSIVDWQRLRRALVVESDWTVEAVDNLLKLSRDYGSFMLRNALALALALGIEDGEFGF